MAQERNVGAPPAAAAGVFWFHGLVIHHRLCQSGLVENALLVYVVWPYFLG